MMTDSKLKGLFDDSRFYDLVFRNEQSDIPFYVQEAKQVGGPVLDLCCGTGRITIPIAEAGIDVVGVDLFPSMLELGKKKAAEKGVQVEWIQADARSFDLKRKFSAVLIPFYSFQHFHDLKSIEAVLSSIKRHLKKDGVFIFEILNPKFTHLAPEFGSKIKVDEFPDPDGRGMVTAEISFAYDPALQMRRVRITYSLPALPEFRKEEVEMRCFYPLEIDNLLHYSGFRVINKLGNFDGSPFNGSESKQVLFCKAEPPL